MNFFQGKGTRYDILFIWTSLSLQYNLILEEINQEGKEEQMKQWLYICGSIIGAILVIFAVMKLYWYCMLR